MHSDRISPLFDQRRAGILLHPTSLPGPFRGGDIGHCAYRFIEFLHRAGCTLWQMLPLGPTHEDGSPYQCMSVHAGNPLLISLDWLVDRALLDLDTVDGDRSTTQFRYDCLHQAGARFFEKADSKWMRDYQTFREQQADWLDDYALFMAIRLSQNNKSWMEWPAPLRHREPGALRKARQEFADTMQQIFFEQYVFFTQWDQIRAYANDHGVMLFGDMPIFVSEDSADVWAQKQNFLIDEDGQAAYVAGVPPDAFSDTGQLWGNPLYDWEYMQDTDFAWWHQRFRTQLELFDLMRIDHFRGFEAGWQIPADEETAINGEWVKVPGRDLLQSLFENFDDLALVAEDLGVITEEVTELRKEFHLPGMKILQFAFGGDSDNPYLPHNHETISVVYTGTHDNDTTLGWYQGLDAHTLSHLRHYVGLGEDRKPDMPWLLNRMALASVARLAVLPLQDILSLDASHRMNTPGTTEGNWLWRFDEESLTQELSTFLRGLLELYGRIPG